MQHIRSTIWLLLCFGICTVKAQTPEAQRQDSTRTIQLDETIVSGYRPGTVLSSAYSLKTETITQTGLKKMACCTLSESFENSASVSVGFTDAVSGARQILVINSVTRHELTSDFGKKTYNGTQTSYDANLLFSSFVHSPAHSYIENKSTWSTKQTTSQATRRKKDKSPRE